jgi:hypothetical protein
MMFTIIALAIAVVLFVVGFASLFTRANTDDRQLVVTDYAQALFRASMSMSAIAAMCRWIGLCLALFLVGCTSPIDRALDKADQLDAVNPVVVCVDYPHYTECAVSGDNFEGVFLLRCSWFVCKEVPPLTR